MGVTRDASSKIAIFVSIGANPRTDGVERLRDAAIRAIQEMGHRLVLTEAVHLQHYLERIDADQSISVFADGPETLDRARAAVGAGRSGIAYCMFVSPTSFSGWGSAANSWAGGLNAAAGENTVFLTDSALSRTVVENQLSAVRADVRVLRSMSPVDDAQVGANFERLKAWRAEEGLPEFSGVTWDFSERSHDAEPVRRADGVDELVRANIAVLENIMEDAPLPGGPLRIGVLGHKLSFIDELARDLGRDSGSIVELDEWAKLSAPADAEHSQALMSRSDVIIGEWGRPNNVWIQKRAAGDKRLIVRVHRYEVTTEFPRAIDMDRFDAGVVIVPWVGRALVQEFDWPIEKMVYIPNYVNAEHFQREKLPGAEFTLGIVGITPDLKRLDLALDLLAALRSIDLRYSLRVRGSLPPTHIHWRTNPRIAEQWEKVLFRLRTDPLLRNSVAFDPPGRDMAAWFEGIGVILSTSDLEGSHVALAEGAASGALPIARPWPGVRTLWPEDFVFDKLDAAVEQILKARDVRWRETAIARVQAHPSLDQRRVLRAWWDLVRGDRESAQAAFGPVDWSSDWYEPVAS